MRRLAIALLLGVGLCGSRPARAFDLRTLAVVDGMVTADPSAGQITNGEVGLRLRADLLGMAGRVDAKLDFWARLAEGTLGTGNPTVQELRELWLKVRDLGGRADITIGRFITPGGFWLIADGARIDLRYTDWLTHSVYGGLRSFTTDRRNVDLTFDNPMALPLAGTALAFRHRLFDLSLTFTWAEESINLPTSSDDAALRLDRHRQDELFLDAQLLIVPTENVTLAGGGSFGTRYDVRFGQPDSTFLVPASLVATLGAVSAWAIAEWRPVKRLRLGYSGVFERIRLISAESALFPTRAGTPQQLATGDFLDNGVQAVALLWKALRAEAQYRIRYRSNTDTEHHLVAGLRGDQLLLDRLGFFASVGVDVIEPGVTTLRRVLYSGGLSWNTPWLDVRAGVLFTDGIGSGLLFSQRQPASMGGNGGVAPAQLFPYVLETNRVAFVRAFGFWRGWLAGIDIEENLDSVQLRALVQLGISR